MENFYWVKIQYDDYEKCRHFQTPFVLFANSKEEAKAKIQREIPGKFSIIGVVELDKSLGAVVLPTHIAEMFAWLYDGTEPGSTPADDTN